MNEAQRRIILAVIGSIVVMSLYPPFAVIGGGPKRFMGYHWLWDRPGQVPIDLATLVTQWAGALLVGGLALWAFNGARLNGAHAAGPSEPKTSLKLLSRTAPLAAPKDLNGVDGWLLLLVINLVLGSPGAYFKNLADGLAFLPQLAPFPAVQWAMKVDWIAGGVLATFSAFAGWRLLKLHPRAPRTATAYLCAAGLYFLAAPFLAMSVTAEMRGPDGSSVDDAVFDAYVRQAFTGLLYVGVWLLYLHFSKRVKATYPATPVNSSGPAWKAP